MKLNFDAVTRPRSEREGPSRQKVGPEVLDAQSYPRWHEATVINAADGKPKSGRGRYLRVGFELREPDVEGYVVWQYFNIHHDKPGVEIRARRELGELMAAAELTKGADSRSLVGITCEVLCEYKVDDYGPGLDAKAFRRLQNPELPPRPAPTPEAPPRQVEPTGAHRYTNEDGVEMEYEPVPEGSKTEWSPKDDPDDEFSDVPF